LKLGPGLRRDDGTFVPVRNELNAMHAELQLELKIAQAAQQRQWRAFGSVMLALAAVFAVFWPTVAAMAEIWNRSETFTHGWLVVPAFVWFAWERRHRLATVPLQPFWPGLIAVAVGGFGWLAANAAGVAVVEQLAVIGLVSACVVTVFGWRFGWELAFPLAFLFFAVPMGEALIPPMMEMTADFTVGALRLTGIPVYREGLFFVIPSGNWSIVEGCSGLRYLIASVTVGCVFAYLYYRSLWRRLAFIAASIAVPIVANWLRAYIIVMLGHLSGNKIAAGADHLIYGWVFFGFVMLLLFWIGAKWREDEAPVPADPHAGSSNIALPGVGLRRIGGAALATLLVVAAWPAWAAYLQHRADSDPRVVQLTAPQDAGGWLRQGEQATEWRPSYKGAAASVFETYAKGGQQVALYVAVYRNQKQGAELINSQNVMIHQKHEVWSNVGETRRAEAIGEAAVPLRQTLLRSAGQRLLIWDWFSISGQDVVNPYKAKLIQARDRILGRGDDGVAIVVAAPYADTPAAAEQALRDFIATMRPSIDAATAKALGQ
jgi:exosortase A